MTAEKTPICLEEILASEETRAFLETLASVSGVSFVVCDRNGTPLRGFPASRRAGRVRRGGPGMGGVSGWDPRDLGHEVRTEERLLGEVRGRVCRGGDAGRVRTIVGLAARWLSDKGRVEHAIESLAGELSNKYEELNLLYELGEEMASVLDTTEICRIVLRKAREVIGAERAAVLLWRPDKGVLETAASLGPWQDPEGGLWRVEPGRGIFGTVLAEGRPLLIEEMTGPGAPPSRRRSCPEDALLSAPLLVSPLRVKERVIGLICLLRRRSAKGFEAGDLKLLSAVGSGAALSVSNSLLVRDLKENERIRREMEIAETVQRNLLPRRAPEMPGAELAGHCVPAERVGGDYFDFFPAPDGNVGFVVADVSGHGIGPGIMMAITRGLLQGEALRSEDPAEMMEDVNRILFPDLVASELFITMAYFVYRPRDRMLWFVNGGHDPPLLLRGDGRGVELLDAEGMAIGMLPEVAFERKIRRLFPGDLVVAYTDGLVEAVGGRKGRDGMERFLEVLDRFRGRSASGILEGLFNAVRSMAEKGDLPIPPEDDMTAVVLKVTFS